MDTCLPTSSVAHQSSFCIPGNMTHYLAPAAALAFICVGLVDGLEVSAQADLACAHLCDDQADHSVHANVCGEAGVAS
jgi:hypothetical protein